MDEYGFNSCKKRKKFILSEEHKQARVDFAMLIKGLDFYLRIKWSDECKIILTLIEI
jgi:hypothetical protein